MLRECLRESFELTKSNFLVFVGSVVLLFVGSLLTVFLMFPVLVAGLEGMYLRAREGRKVRATDILMYRTKFFRLIGASLLILLDIFLSTLVLSLILVLVLVLVILVAKTEPTSLIVFAIAILYSIGYMLLILYREGQYLHALNFITECGLGTRDSLRESKRATKKRWRAAFLAFLYLLSMACLFSVLGGYSLLLTMSYSILGLFLFPLIVGATAMAFAHDVEVSKEGTNEPRQ